MSGKPCSAICPCCGRYKLRFRERLGLMTGHKFFCPKCGKRVYIRVLIFGISSAFVFIARAFFVTGGIMAPLFVLICGTLAFLANAYFGPLYCRCASNGRSQIT